MSDIEIRYYQQLTEKCKMVKIHLFNGYCLEGRIKEYDEKVITLEVTIDPKRTKAMLIYTQSISNVEPFNP